MWGDRALNGESLPSCNKSCSYGTHLISACFLALCQRNGLLCRSLDTKEIKKNMARFFQNGLLAGSRNIYCIYRKAKMYPLHKAF